MERGRVFAGKVLIKLGREGEQECPIAVINDGIERFQSGKLSFLIFLRPPAGSLLRIFLYIDLHRFEQALAKNMRQYWDVRVDPLAGRDRLDKWAEEQPLKGQVLEALGVDTFTPQSELDPEQRIPSHEELWEVLSGFVLRQQSNLAWVQYLRGLQTAVG